jgi:hypothetical protein
MIAWNSYVPRASSIGSERMSDGSGLNPTPHAIAVYASRPLSPGVTQPPLPSGRCPLLGRSSTGWIAQLAWRTHSITSCRPWSACDVVIVARLDANGAKPRVSSELVSWASNRLIWLARMSQASAAVMSRLRCASSHSACASFCSAYARHSADESISWLLEI